MQSLAFRAHSKQQFPTNGKGMRREGKIAASTTGGS
jgi:hypothetical protein